MDYEERLSHLKTLVSVADKVVDELPAKLNFIYENNSRLKQLLNLDSSATFFSLEQSKHKEFIKCITLILDLSKNINQNVFIGESSNASSLKSSLQQEEAVHQRNEQILKTLERVIIEMQYFNSQEANLPRDERSL